MPRRRGHAGMVGVGIMSTSCEGGGVGAVPPQMPRPVFGVIGLSRTHTAGSGRPVAAAGTVHVEAVGG
ncbi:hypothetical protein HXX76_016058 [Chlamydomonas incerta]|uniref:Uncharacterized protein n=1 Tax=Chlamydomonas incerta TaxID=51695 RepID=A0A835VQS5_CHLIN|nr:hypothetical protein HXX76_016058 [Chlamydomonas incerta]|eukprot:KAG2422413.1 hypothetical protein HXX76_016058 [Chlamydomonas incerta]